MPRAFNSLFPRNKFAKRHYEAIATAIQEARRRVEAGDNNHDPIANVVDELLVGCSGVITACSSVIGSGVLASLVRMSGRGRNETHNIRAKQKSAPIADFFLTKLVLESRS